MTLSPEDVDHVALLARLGLRDDEKAKLAGDLDAILAHISRVQQVDTSALAETAQVGDLVNVMRDDIPEASLGTDRALLNAPARDDGYFVVGAIQANELDG
jgi:aspartyl-tRNA(Asn)/glutamyl-tRNA(Gln) amidotransferase subunit C